MFLIPLCSLFLFASDLTVAKRYEAPPEDADVYLGDPYDFAFSPKGELFVVDRDSAAILVWRADGGFDRYFGAKGSGPGELDYPFHLAVTKDELYVLELRRQITVFDHAGNFKRLIKITGSQPRGFNLLSPDKLVYIHPKSENRQGFELHNGAGEHQSTLFEVESKYHAAAGFAAFAAEADMQQAPDGTFWLGYSQDPVLHQVNSAGKIVAEKRFALKTSVPTADEKKTWLKMDLFAPWMESGRSKMEGLDFNFTLPKGYFTYFLIKSDKVAFIQTPTGGFWGTGHGYAVGTYYVCSMKTGAVLHRGAFDFPGDSMVLFENDRAMGFIVNEDGDRDVVELKLTGFDK